MKDLIEVCTECGEVVNNIGWEDGKGGWDMKFDLVGLEIDEHFFQKANKRLNAHKKQLTLF